ncbi:MAG: SRPBCC family protein [Myxococcota bacterium]
MTALYHHTMSMERTWKASLDRVWAAWTDPELKLQWFRGPEGQWEPLRTSIDFRVGGTEIHEGRFVESGMVSLYTSRVHLIEAPSRLVYAYDMHLNGEHHSVSLATVELEARGGATTLRYHEQIVFVDGEDSIENRREGTEGLLDRIGALILAE